MEIELGAFCTRPCEEGCPTGWECKQVPDPHGGEEPVGLCAVIQYRLCQACVDFELTYGCPGTVTDGRLGTLAQANNPDTILTATALLTVILTATMASVGTAAVPGVGLVTLALVLGQAGLPVEGIGLILGVDRLLDMMRTACNVTGDCAVTCIIAWRGIPCRYRRCASVKATLPSLSVISCTAWSARHRRQGRRCVSSSNTTTRGTFAS